jgi:hypothetical protein
MDMAEVRKRVVAILEQLERYDPPKPKEKKP